MSAYPEARAPVAGRRVPRRVDRPDPSPYHVLAGVDGNTEVLKMKRTDSEYEPTAEETWRVFRIMAEFVEAVEVMSEVGPAVAIFGGSRAKRSDWRRIRHICGPFPRPADRVTGQPRAIDDAPPARKKTPSFLRRQAIKRSKTELRVISFHGDNPTNSTLGIPFL